MNKLYYISSDLFLLPSYPFLENFYKKLLELDCCKILQTKGSQTPKLVQDQFNLPSDKIVQSLDDADQHEYSIICSDCSDLDSQGSDHQDIFVIMHPVDVTDLSTSIENCIKLNATAILSEILPDEITEAIDNQLISFYAQRFIYLSAYHTQSCSPGEIQKNKSKQLIIYDNQVDANSRDVKIPEDSFLILADRPEIDAVRFDHLDLTNSNSLISKMRDYACVHLFIKNPTNESFIVSILNASACPFYSTKSNLSPIRFLWNVSQQEVLTSLFGNDNSIRSKLQKIMTESKDNSDKKIEKTQCSFYSEKLQINAIFKDLKSLNLNAEELMFSRVQDIYSTETNCLFPYYKIAKLDETANYIPQWIMNPAMGQSYLSLVNYFLEYQDVTCVNELVENLMKFWAKHRGSLSRIAMQTTIESYHNLFDEQEEYAGITPAIEKFIMHDIMAGTAQHNAIVVLYAYLCKNGRSDQAKQILNRVIEDKMLVVALPAIFLYSWYNNIKTNIDFTKIAESLEDRNFHPYPERFLSLIILYLINGLNERAETAFGVLVTRNQKLFTIKNQGDKTLNRWHLMSICHKLNNENERADYFQKLAFKIDKKKEGAWLRFYSKIDANKNKIQTTIKIPNFSTN